MTDQQAQPDDERDVAALLQAAGAREQPPAEMLERWETLFRSEINVQRHRRRRRVGVAFAAAASLLLALGLALRVMQPEPGPISTDSVATVVSLHGVNVAGDGKLDLVAGRALPGGTRIATGSGGFVALSYRGYDLRLNGGTGLTLFTDHVLLDRGRLYVSGSSAGTGMRVVTRHGSISDIGTQFLVAVESDGTSARVRRGRIEVRNATGTYTASGDGDVAEELSFDGDSAPSRRGAAARGADWEWIHARARNYSLDGRPAHEFLRWAADETGRRLEYADAAARHYARTTVLRGTPGSLNPESSLHPVLLTTDLRASYEGSGVLRVELLAEAGPAATDPP